MLKGINILLVDDNIVNQKIAGFMLKKQHAEIAIAMNGQEAIDLLKEKKFDIVLMDLQMPGMDGFAATEYIRKEMKSDVPIIAVTADIFVSETRECLDAGMNACVSKPFDIDNLCELILSLRKKN